MKRSSTHAAGICFALGLALFAWPSASRADTRYVDTGSANPVSPYTSWGTAATGIGDAVGVSTDGDTVLVADGVYRLNQTIVVTNGVSVESVNGAGTTIIDGGYPARSNRCFFVSHSNAVVEGFTMRGGYDEQGGAVQIATNGTLRDCVLTGNVAEYGGGGVYLMGGGHVTHCSIASNRANYGGGVCGSGGGTVENCRIVSNTADSSGGLSCWRCDVRNCLVAGNSVEYSAGGIECNDGVVDNCTVIGNSADDRAGGIMSYSSTLVRNCVVYYNQATRDPNYFANSTSSNYIHTCTIPLPQGAGSLSNFPGVAALDNPHLVAASPCINAGTNIAAMATDIDGEPRVHGGVIDIGCDEYVAAEITGSLSASVHAQFPGVVVDYPVRFDAYLDGKANGTRWDLDDGTIVSNVAAVTHVFGAGGQYAVTFSAWNPDHAVTVTTVVDVVEAFTNYVSPGGSHGAPFTSWGTAATNIRDAVEAAFPGGTVLVGDGTYLLSGQVEIYKGIRLVSQNGTNTTFVDGGRQDRCFLLSHEGALIDGLTITNGWSRDGGGVYIDGGGTVRNCRIAGNRGEDPQTGSLGQGGGVYCMRGGRLLNCTLSGNYAAWGGGVQCNDGGVISNCTVSGNSCRSDGGGIRGYYHFEVLDSRIIDNEAGQHGGGTACQNPGAVFRGCTISGNTATNGTRRGGGMYIYRGGTVEDCEITGNTAIQGAGVAFYYDGGILSNCVVHGNFTPNDGGGAWFYRGGFMTDCTVASNTARYGGGLFYYYEGGEARGCRLIGNDAVYQGGGIYFREGGALSDSTVAGNTAGEGGGVKCNRGGTVSRCDITDNRAGNDGGGISFSYGGSAANCPILRNAARNGGGVEMYRGGSLTNCAIMSNTAEEEAGGAYTWYNDCSLYSCTVVGNSAPYGGGLYCNNGGTLRNTIVYDNTGHDGPNVYIDSPPPTLAYCCTIPNPGGTGNITNAPLVASLDNPHLLLGSPCVNAGNNGDASGLDIDGEVRIDGGTIDIGCDEFIVAAVTGSLAVAISADAEFAVLGQPIQFTSAIEGKVTRYAWDLGDGTTVTNTPSITRVYSSLGVYPVVLTAWNNDGPVRATTTVEIVTGYTNYVSLTGSHVPPFTDWGTAATSIQAAVDANMCVGGVTLVAPGVYDQGSSLHASADTRVVIDKRISVLGASGDPGDVRIVGTGPAGVDAVRCAYVGGGATLGAVTLTNGYTRTSGSSFGRSGGGAFCENGVLSNSVVVGCFARSSGGGVRCGPNVSIRGCTLRDNVVDDGSGGGVHCEAGQVTIRDCTLTGNRANYGGGCNAYDEAQLTIRDCTFDGNDASYGGGLRAATGTVATDCRFRGNTVTSDGGGLYFSSGGLAENVTFTGNESDSYGGAAYLSRGGTLRNAFINACSADRGGGVYCYRGGQIQSSTVCHNTADYGGGVYCDYAGTVIDNTILYFNTSNNDPAYPNYEDWDTVFLHSCTVPHPGGTGNITNDPVFVDQEAGNYRLAADSPCVDSGAYQAWMANGVDLDGNPRVLNGTVDRGAYENGPLYCSFTADPTTGLLPLTIDFRSRVSGTNVASAYYRWDFDADGHVDAEGLGLSSPQHVYTAEGGYSVRLIVSNAVGATAERLRVDYIAAVMTNIHYVSPMGGNVYPYVSWATAATNIQAAVDVCLEGGRVRVTSGVYRASAEIAMEKDVLLLAVKGAPTTILDGENAHRGFRLGPGAVLDGFTITNCNSGALASGWDGTGGGVLCRGGGTVRNCVIVGCVSGYVGGGADLREGGLLQNCEVHANRGANGGGVSLTFGGGTVENCTIRDNDGRSGRGGGLWVYQGGLVRNSFITGNTARWGGGVCLEYSGTLMNCTVAGNAATERGGGVRCQFGGAITNSIVYYNGAPKEPNIEDDRGAFSHVCSVPDPGGIGNITNLPGLVSRSNPHLIEGSPCIDSGTHTAYSGTYDLDGDARTNSLLVDIGCDEFSVASLTGSMAVAIRASATNVAAGYPIAFEARIDGRVQRFAWDFGDGMIVSNACDVTHAYAAAADPVVVLSAWNNDGMAGATLMVHVVSGYTNYASLSGSHQFPFTSWVTAATNIQAAVDANNVAGGVTLVAPGTYTSGTQVVDEAKNRLVIRKALTVRGVDRTTTVIEGKGPLGEDAVRCAYIDGGGVLSNLTLRNGHTLTSGPNVSCQSGGGAVCGAGGTIVGCDVVNNAADYRGGGVFCEYGGTLRDCLVSGNSCLPDSGGGVCCYYAGKVERCVVRNNEAKYGGGIRCYWGGEVLSCEARDNHASSYGGGITMNGGSIARNCLVIGNTSDANGGGLGCGEDDLVENCTIVQNASTANGGGVAAASGAGIRNCIIYANSGSGNSSNIYNSGGTFAYCCTAPAMSAIGEVVADPEFLQMETGDFRLSTGSPCIDAGTNLSWMAGASDLVGVPRVGGTTADIGAHETGPLGCAFVANSTIGVSPFMVQFRSMITGTNSHDLWYGWDVDGDGRVDISGAGVHAPQHTYTAIDIYSAALTVSNTAAEAAHLRREDYITVLVTNVQYVSHAGAHIYPFNSWADAATNIQAAVDAAMEGGTVLVAADVYYPGAPLVVRKRTTVLGADGADTTVIDGNHAHRCCTIGPGAVLDGLTIRNGHAPGLQGGGVLCDRGGTIRRCIITGNFTEYNGAGGRGGGVRCEYGGQVLDSVVAHNTGSGPGGVSCYYGGMVSNCVIYGNTADGWGGGGVWLEYNGLAVNCIITNNITLDDGGGGVDAENGSVVRGCLIADNRARYGGGVSSYRALVENCTITGNEASYRGGGVNVETGCTTLNSIVYFNTCPDGSNVYEWSAATYLRSCLAPVPPSATDCTGSNPLFVDAEAGDYHLMTNSPCVDSGSNQTWMGTATDVEGKPRVLNATVELGAYELIPAGLDSDGDQMPDWWEWRHSRTTTGMLANADEDGDGMRNRAEWYAGTDASNPDSYLGFTAAAGGNGAGGFVVRWSSISNRLYELKRSTNLWDGFTETVTSGIPATPPINVHTDSAAPAPPVYYRINLDTE